MSRDVTEEKREEKKRKKERDFMATDDSDNELMSKIRDKIWNGLSEKEQDFFLAEINKKISGIKTFPEVGKKIAAKDLAFKVHLSKNETDTV